jgi:hypothetical protein
VALRKDQRKEQPGAEPLVRIVEVLAELAGSSNPGIWRAEAEELATTMRAAVVRDWRGDAALSPIDAERLYLRMQRDRQQATQEQAERLAVLEAEQGPFLGAGIVGAETPGEADWRAPGVKVRELL